MIANRDAILDILRERICLIPPNQQVVLKEKELADEFGLSRTPIRQVLQKLASEGMVVVRPGVGTVTTTVDGKDMTRYLTVLQLVLQTIAEFTQGQTPSAQVALELAATRRFIERIDQPSVETFIRLSTKIAAARASAVGDSVLATAYSSAFWRVVRWRAYEMSIDMEANWPTFVQRIEKITSPECLKSTPLLFGASVAFVDLYKQKIASNPSGTAPQH